MLGGGVDFLDRVAEGVAAVIKVIQTGGKTVALPGGEGLVGGEAGREVGAVEEIFLGGLVRRMTVVDDVVAPVVEEVDGAGTAVTVILQGDARHAADRVGRTVQHRGGDGAGIL